MQSLTQFCYTSTPCILLLGMWFGSFPGWLFRGALISVFHLFHFLVIAIKVNVDVITMVSAQFFDSFDVSRVQFIAFGFLCLKLTLFCFSLLLALCALVLLKFRFHFSVFSWHVEFSRYQVEKSVKSVIVRQQRRLVR